MDFLLPEGGYACVQCGKACHGMRVWVEPERIDSIRQHALALDLSAQVVEQGPEGARLRPDASGACQLLAPDRLCRLHRDLGWAAKPRACRQFPWFLTETPDGTQVGLSYRCTAVQQQSGGAWSEQLAQLQALRQENPPRRVGFEPVAVAPGFDLSWAESERWQKRWRQALASGEALGSTCYAELQPALGCVLDAVSWQALLRWLAAGAVGCLEAARAEQVEEVAAAVRAATAYESPRFGPTAALEQPFAGANPPELVRYLDHVLERQTLWWPGSWLGRLLLTLTGELLVRFYARREGVWGAIDRVEGEWLGHAERFELERGYAALLLNYCAQ